MNKFKELRKSKHLTQEELVEQFNNRYGKQYTASSISMFESGKRIPETQSLIDFADFFEVSIDYLLGHEVKQDAAPDIMPAEEVRMATNIKNIRIQNNLTQAELGEALGMSPSTIGMYEQGRREPDAGTIVQFAKFFNVSTDYLLGYTVEQDAVSRPLSIWEQAEKELDKDDLQQLETLARYFLKKKRGEKE